MRKIQKHIEIVRSTNSKLSSMSSKSCEAIHRVLSKNFKSVHVSIVNNQDDLQKLASKRPDLVFMGMKYVPGDTAGSKIWVSEYLDKAAIPHTGSSQIAISRELQKPSAKLIMQAEFIPTAQFIVLKSSQSFEAKQLGQLQYPLFVKPSNLGGGDGVDENSIVKNIDELNTKIATMTKRYPNADVLIEEYLPGREFSVAILKNPHTGEFMTMPIELIAPLSDKGEPILSNQVKLSNEEAVLPITDLKLYTSVVTTALDAFHAIEATDYGRIDIKLDENGIPNFLEANLIPSLISGYGSFPKACVLNIGMEYEEMIVTITNLAISRQMKNHPHHNKPIISQTLAPAKPIATVSV